MVATHHDHVAGWAVQWAYGHSPNKIHLSSRNHVSYTGDGIKHVAHFAIVQTLFLHFFVEMMRQMLRWRNTSNVSSCNFCSDQVSTPHRSRFIEIALKTRYLLYMSRWGLRHRSFRAPIEAFAAAILAVMLLLSCKL
jgi:hypothetical protein